MDMKEKYLAAFSGFAVGCIWLSIVSFLLLVQSDDVMAMFTNFDTYKTTSGMIVSSSVVYKSGLGGSWHFEIQYKYMVSGEEFTSDKVHFLNTGEGLSDGYAKSYVEKYPVGKTVTVYFNPTNPAKSVLEPENRSYSSLWLIIFLITMAIVFLSLSARVFLQRE